ncbi:hypothetical protein PGB90_003322 [Kerria lacca]
MYVMRAVRVPSKVVGSSPTSRENGREKRARCRTAHLPYMEVYEKFSVLTNKFIGILDENQLRIEAKKLIDLYKTDPDVSTFEDELYAFSNILFKKILSFEYGQIQMLIVELDNTKHLLSPTIAKGAILHTPFSSSPPSSAFIGFAWKSVLNCLPS